LSVNTQLPQLRPAHVAALTCAIVRAPSSMARVTSRSVTTAQWQTIT
jgi:hypothetical protein